MADYSGFDISSIETNFATPQGSDGFNIASSGVIFGNLGGTIIQPIYRGKLGGEYVYSLGSPPGGASDIIIIGYT